MLILKKMFVQRKKIIVGLSGGVDSSVTALILLREGYDVIGITIKMCESNQDDAKKTAAQLGILHFVIDVSKKFKEMVSDPFIDGYKKGETPLPCALCNRHIKMETLALIADMFAAFNVATGHYVIKNGENIFIGKDVKRDQSFFLFNIAPRHVRMLLCPLGMFSKEQTRIIARDNFLVTSEKPASNDLCFAGDREFKKKYNHAIENLSWDVVLKNGSVVAKHKGVATIGQRKGLCAGGLSCKKYIQSIDPEACTITISDREDLAVTDIFLRDINWIINDENDIIENVSVKIRSSGTPVTATIYKRKNMVRLHRPEYGIATGQACVFYIEGKLIGGGWIRSCLP